MFSLNVKHAGYVTYLQQKCRYRLHTDVRGGLSAWQFMAEVSQQKAVKVVFYKCAPVGAV